MFSHRRRGHGRRQRRRRIEGCAVLRLHRRAGGKQKRGDRSKQHSRAEPAPETGFRSSRTDDNHKKPHARAPYLGAGVPAGATCASCSVRSPRSHPGSRSRFAVRSGYREVRVREPSGRSNPPQLHKPLRTLCCCVERSRSKNPSLGVARK